jgi:ATP-independent RNA helicase DbpA
LANNKKEGFMKLPPALTEVLQELGYDTLTPIQKESIPPLLQGKDLIGQAKTGSGKTAAFMLPILAKIKLKPRDLQALILCPTRELGAQVAREARKLGRRLEGLQVLILTGGQPLGPQRAALEKGAHIAIGTPGRLVDHLFRGMDLSRVKTIVLDEADRMLDMGFEEDMEKILRAVPEKRQTVLFSATFPDSIESISKKFQHQPKRVTIADTDGDRGNDLTSDISQSVYATKPEDKLKVLLWLLQSKNPESTLVFCNQKITVATVARDLAHFGISVGQLHGDLEQYERDRVMAQFRNRSIRVLLATDVAARGIDVENLELVCNYDLPPKPEVYIHRIGRTGRAGKKGEAISLASSREEFKLDMIEKLTGISIHRLRCPSDKQIGDVRAASGAPQEAAMVTLFISGGRKEKMRPGDILGALTGEAGRLDAKDVGKIEIHDHFSYVAVSNPISQKALLALRNGRIKGRKFTIEII